MNNITIKELRRLILSIKNNDYFFNREIFLGYIRCLRDLEIIDLEVYFRLEYAINHITNKYKFEREKMIITILNNNEEVEL